MAMLNRGVGRDPFQVLQNVMLEKLRQKHQQEKADRASGYEPTLNEMLNDEVTRFNNGEPQETSNTSINNQDAESLKDKQTKASVNERLRQAGDSGTTLRHVNTDAVNRIPDEYTTNRDEEPMGVQTIKGVEQSTEAPTDEEKITGKVDLNDQSAETLQDKQTKASVNERLRQSGDTGTILKRVNTDATNRLSDDYSTNRDVTSSNVSKTDRDDVEQAKYDANESYDKTNKADGQVNTDKLDEKADDTINVSSGSTNTANLDGSQASTVKNDVENVADAKRRNKD